MKYERRSETVQAQQWRGNLEDITVAKIRQIEGVTGYNGKLAYYDKPNGQVLTIRPNDYIIKKANDMIVIMVADAFEKTYREVANSKNSSNNSRQSKKAEDNFLEN